MLQGTDAVSTFLIPKFYRSFSFFERGKYYAEIGQRTGTPSEEAVAIVLLPPLIEDNWHMGPECSAHVRTHCPVAMSLAPNVSRGHEALLRGAITRAAPCCHTNHSLTNLDRGIASSLG